jgi:hypothetical protein
MTAPKQRLMARRRRQILDDETTDRIEFGAPRAELRPAANC